MCTIAHACISGLTLLSVQGVSRKLLFKAQPPHLAFIIIFLYTVVLFITYSVGFPLFFCFSTCDGCWGRVFLTGEALG